MPDMIHSSFLSTAGNLGSIVAGVGILGSVLVWLWRRSRRRVFPNLRVEITGEGYLTIERVIAVAGGLEQPEAAGPMDRAPLPGPGWRRRNLGGTWSGT